mgnify:CR=1 FL=1
MFVVNHCTVTPVRQEPSEGSEQLTQLLFGEVCEVLDRLPRWTKIRSILDGQEGWVDFKMLTTASNLSPNASTPATVPEYQVDFDREKLALHGMNLST